MRLHKSRLINGAAIPAVPFIDFDLLLVMTDRRKQKKHGKMSFSAQLSLTQHEALNMSHSSELMPLLGIGMFRECTAEYWRGSILLSCVLPIRISRSGSKPVNRNPVAFAGHIDIENESSGNIYLNLLTSRF